MKGSRQTGPRCRTIGALCFAAALLVVMFVHPLHAAERPNILILLADDLGYSDLGCYGGEIETPNLDALASHGVRFTKFYNAARCCPSRAALLTGLYPHQTGVGRMVYRNHGPGYLGHLNRHCVTMGEVLRGAGYQTMMAGKWHVGHQRPEVWPENRGFEKFTGIHMHVDSYWKVLRGCEVHRDGEVVIGAQDNPPNPYHPNEPFYTTDYFTDVALEYIDAATAKSDKPFLLHVCYNAPHFPLETPDVLIEKYRGRYREGWDVLRVKKLERMKRMGLIPPTQKLPGTLGVNRNRVAKPLPKWDTLSKEDRDELDFRRAMYAGQIDRLDWNIGRLIERLKARGVFDNTLILFLSDNGCSAEHGDFGMNWGKHRSDNYEKWKTLGNRSISQGQCWASLSNAPFRKYKRFTHEGGVATPFIAHWPAGIAKPGRINTDQVGHIIDIMPTLCEVAGATYPKHHHENNIHPMEGISLLNYLRQANTPPQSRTLFWQHERQSAVRHGDWKLVTVNDRSEQTWELYNLAEDRSETENLTKMHPEIVEQLRGLWCQWARRIHAIPFPEERLE